MRSSRDRGSRPRLIGRIDRRFGYRKEGVRGGYDMTNTVGSTAISRVESTRTERLRAAKGGLGCLLGRIGVRVCFGVRFIWFAIILSSSERIYGDYITFFGDLFVSLFVQPTIRLDRGSWSARKETGDRGTTDRVHVNEHSTWLDGVPFQLSPRPVK